MGHSTLDLGANDMGSQCCGFIGVAVYLFACLRAGSEGLPQVIAG